MRNIVGMMSEYLPQPPQQIAIYFFNINLSVQKLLSAICAIRNVHSPVDCKDVAELVPGVDVRGHAETKHYGIFAMQHQCPVDDVDEKMNVGRVSEITHHGLEHETH